MTWYFDRDTSEVIEDSPALDSPTTHATLPERRRLPDDVIDVMREVWETEVNINNSPDMSARAAYILMDMVQENIVYGRPEGY